MGILSRSRQTPGPREIFDRQQGLKARLGKRFAEIGFFRAYFLWRLGDGQANDRDQGDSHLDVIDRCNTPTMNIASAFPSL